MPLTALVTRPEEDAKPLAEALIARGVATVIEPLLAITPLSEAAEGLTKDLAGVQALLFTSANGARAFAALSPRRDIGVLAVGDATATAARSLGFTAVESAAGDVQDLVRLAKERLKPAGGPLFHAAGSAVAGDLAQLLAAAGFELRRRMLYESRQAEAFTPDALTALKKGAIDLVLLFSPRTATTFSELAKAAGVDTVAMTAICLSPNVALAVADRSWKAVRTAVRPDLPAMLELVDREIQAQEEATRKKLAEAKPEPVSEAIEPKPAPAPKAAAHQPPAAPVPPPPAKAQRARAGFGSILLAAIFGAALAGGAMYGVLKYAPERLNLLPAASGLAGGEAMADLARRTDDLKSQIADLASRVEALPKAAPDLGDLPQRLTDLEQKVAALPTAGGTGAAATLPPTIADLPGRVAVLESKLEQAKPAAALPAQIAALPQRVTAVEQRLTFLESHPGSVADVAGLKAAVAALKDDTAALDQRLKTLEAAAGELGQIKQSLDEIAAGGGRVAAARAGVALALGDLRQAVESGKPYADLLDQLKNLSRGDDKLAAALDPAVTALAPTAAAGVPTLGALQARFVDAAPAIIAAAGTVELPANASLTDRVLAHLEALVSIRPVGDTTTGDSAEAHVARAEAKLSGGDVAAAVDEIAALTGKPADAAADWLALAKARLAALKAMADLQAAAVAALAAAVAP